MYKATDIILQQIIDGSRKIKTRLTLTDIVNRTLCK